MNYTQNVLSSTDIGLSADITPLHDTSKASWLGRTVYVLSFPLSTLAHLIYLLARRTVMNAIMPPSPPSQADEIIKRALFTQCPHFTLPGKGDDLGFIRMPSGAKIEAAIFHPEKLEDPLHDRPTVILCGGNNGGYEQLSPLIKYYVSQGVNVAAFNYRGTGASDRQPYFHSEHKLYEEGEAVYSYLAKEMGIPNRQMIFHGYSLGGAVASHIAARCPGSHLILDRTFANTFSIAKDRSNFFLALIASLHAPMKVEQAVRQLSGKLLIIASEDDSSMNEEQLRHSDRIFHSYQTQAKSAYARTSTKEENIIKVRGIMHLDPFPLISLQYPHLHKQIQAFTEDCIDLPISLKLNHTQNFASQHHLKQCPKNHHTSKFSHISLAATRFMNG